MNLTLTNNFCTWMRTILLQCGTNIKDTTTSTNGLSSVGNLVGAMKDMNGNEFTTMYLESSSYTATLNYWKSGNSGLSGAVYFCVGMDNTIATSDDYMLSGDYVIGTDYSFSHRAISNPKLVNGKAQLAYSVTFTAINDITIGEVGLAKVLPSNSSTGNHVLFGRVALDTPIELSAGESATFQVTVEI